MKLPRDVSAQQLEKALNRLGYFKVRQTGSHMTLEHESVAEWQVGFPNHSPLKVGMLARALDKIAEQQGISVTDLVRKLKL